MMLADLPYFDYKTNDEVEVVEITSIEQHNEYLRKQKK
jgi:hypothetical protein